jgi:hypothetical protein
VTEKRTDAQNRPRYFNRAVFSDCHEFAAQSTITFGGEDEALVALPANLNLELQLEAEIDTVSAWEGSEVRAKLLKAAGPLHEGAELTGVIRNVERHSGRNASVEVVLEWTRALDKGRSYRLAARPVDMPAGIVVKGAAGKVPAGFRMRWRTAEWR